MMGRIIVLPCQILLEASDLMALVDPMTVAAVARTLGARPSQVRWYYDELPMSSFTSFLQRLVPEYTRTMNGQREVARVLTRLRAEPPAPQPVFVRPPPGGGILANAPWLVGYYKSGNLLVPTVVAARG
jgi:hypothetical protein